MNTVTRLMAVCASLAVAAAAAASQESAAPTSNPVVVLETTAGNITIELFKDRAPASVENFLQYAREGHYDGTIFHRVIKGFMIQGGGYTVDLDRKPTRAPVKNEAANKLQNRRGTVAMARTEQVRSATSEFFINTADNPRLDHKGFMPSEYGYAVFGTVTAGMEVVDAIEKLKTGRRGPFDDVPIEPVVIKKVRELPARGA